VIALLFSSLLGLLSATGAPALTAELLVDHPGLRAGTYEAAREDWLAALEAEPTSPLAYPAAMMVRAIGDICHEPLDPGRLRALAAEVEDATASHLLRDLLLREVRRACFSDRPVALEEDLFADFLGRWHVLGPYGPMTESSPLYRDDPEAPEHRLVASYPSSGGPPLTWHALRRPRQRNAVYPTAPLHPVSGGVSYLLSFVEADVAQARLEVTCHDAFQVWWNGSLVIDRRREAPTDRAPRLLAPVSLAKGWNALLIRFPTQRTPFIGARLLDPEGRHLDVREAEWNGSDLPEWSRTVPAAPLEPPPAPPAGSFEEVLAMLVALNEDRADEALAFPEPTDPALLPPWLRVRHSALLDNPHLPVEVERRLQLEVEERLARLGVTYPSVELSRARRLIEEDKPDEAFTIADALVAEHPDVVAFHWLRASCLLALDPKGALARPELMEILERFGEHEPTLTHLAQDAARAGDWTGAVELFRRALRAGGCGIDDPGKAFSWLSLDRGKRSDEAKAWLEAWRRDFPGDEYADSFLIDLLAERGDLAGVRTWLDAHVRSGRYPLSALLALAGSPVMDGREEAVAALLYRALELEPGNHGARRTLELLGEPDEAEAFFREFAPDVEAARAAEVSRTDASTALVLDSGMVYMYPDGASRYRTHSIQLALDRTGTERLHEEPARPLTRVARVLDAEGKVFEPVLVGGSWVWPSLDPGDSVEQVYDRLDGSTPGTIPEVGAWYFASFEQPFVYSRYVFFVPDHLAGEWRQARFEGTHEEIPWRGGTVHVFLRESQPRYKEEPFRPTNEELLPWVRYGVDTPLDEIVADFTRYARYLSALAADLRAELVPIVAAVEGTERERAEALFALVTERVLEFGGRGDTTDVWTMRRGDPIGLLAALYRLAGIEHAWAVLTPPISPELDPDPEPAFVDHGRYGMPCLRLSVGGGEPLWVLIPPGGRELAFGSIPDEFAGARALILGTDPLEYDEVPRTDLADSWALDLDVTYRLDAAGDAAAEGKVRVTGARGALVREQVSQIEPQQRSQVARNLASTMIQGLDLGEWEFVDLDRSGAPLVLAFSGRVPGFVEGVEPSQSCRLRLPPADLSTSFGPSEREWPLVFRSTNRTRARVRVECGDAWSYEYGPETQEETRDGFRYELSVEREDAALEVQRVIELRGLYLRPDAVPEFLTRAKEYEDTEKREVTLRKR